MKLVLNSPARLLVLLLIAVILRCDTFGDPNLHGDENFYLTVGAAMHHGALPYVDVWDRKPLGLFILYWLIAAISTGPLAYQLVATLFAAGTAWAIGEIARATNPGLKGRPQGMLLAGWAYLLWLAPLQGYGGQSPVFYNLFIAGAILLVLRSRPSLERGHVPAQVPLAMLLGGMAITIKTSALFEASFVGLLAAWLLTRSKIGAARGSGHAAGWALIGATPALLIAAWYWHIGFWPEYWHAMVTSNIDKVPDWPTAWLRFRILFVQLSPIIAVAAFGVLEQPREQRGFVLMWLAAAFVGLLSVPNFYPHYALPLLVPLSVAAVPLFARRVVGRIALLAILVLSLLVSPIFQFDHMRRSRAAIAALADAARDHAGGRGLFVFDGPPQLYTLTGQRFMTPLVFPTHLSHLIEKDVSHLSTLGETRRVLAARPGVVVMATGVRNAPENTEARDLVQAWVLAHCRPVTQVLTPERGREDWIAVWGDCR